MCERCTIIESAFGLKDPLPPRVASLDASTAITYAKYDHGQSLSVKDEFHPVPATLHEDALDPLCLPDGINSVWQPPTSTLSGIRDSLITPHR